MTLAIGCSPAGSLPPAATSTLVEASTTVAVAAPTTSAAPNTTGIEPYPLPTSQPRSEVPGDEVGVGWYVALYDSTNANPTSAADLREGPVVLYLVDREGNRYEVASWAPRTGPDALVDAWDSKALVVGAGVNVDETIYHLVDLTSGEMRQVYSVGFPENSYHIDWELSLTRPTAENLVLYRSDGASQWLERRSPDGTTLATLFEGPYTDGRSAAQWLYGYEGNTVLVSSLTGLSLVSNLGGGLARIAIPDETRCDPVRWWAAGTLLAVCYGQSAASAPVNEFGPHVHYGRLWLLEIDGSTGVPLTNYPVEPPIVSDFGYGDAWRTGETTLLQWLGDAEQPVSPLCSPTGRVHL